MTFFKKVLFHLINWISRRFFASRLSYAHVRAFTFNNSFKKFTNFVRTHIAAKRGFIYPKTKPYIFVLEVTNICNLKCPFCLTGKRISGGRSVRHMDLEEAKKIIDQVADYVYLLQLYTWGEPLLNKYCIPIIKYAKSKNLFVMLSTNATAMTHKYNEELISSGLDYLTVAIDGFSEESYPVYRIGGDFKDVMNNVTDLIKTKKQLGSDHPFIEWQYVVFRHNEDEAVDAESYAYNAGFNKFTPLPAYVENEDWLPRDEKYRPKPLNPERLEKCIRPWTHLNVRADGGVASCCYSFLKKDDFGNIHDGPFETIWENPNFTSSRRMIYQHSKHIPLEKSDLICRDCILSGIRPSYSPETVVSVDAPNPGKENF